MLINLDLSGAEWAVVAYLSRDSRMLEVVKSGQSPHPITGSLISGLPVEVVIKDHKLIGDNTNADTIMSLRKSQLPEVFKASFLPRTMSIRQAGKKSNHALDYRESYKMFALMNELEESEAKKIVDLYTSDKCYPGIQRWWNSIDEQVRATRTLTNCFGRKCYFMGALNDDTFKAATAFVPQSTVFDISARAMPLFMEDESPAFEPAQLLAQGHDSTVFQYVKRDFPRMAEFCVKFGLGYFSPTLDYGEPFTLGVGMKVGFDKGLMVEVDLTPDVDKLARSLEEAWEKLIELNIKKRRQSLSQEPL